MSEEAPVDWMAKGRQEQWASRPIHALYCFKQELERRPDHGDARFHSGEVLWQLGCLEQAKAEWREATERAPTHLASWLALAEACLATGDAEAARTAARSALALHPDEPRARTFRLIADASLGEADVDWSEVADAVRGDPGMVFAPARAKLIAAALARTAGAPGQDVLLADLARTPARAPLELLAVIAARAAEGPAAAPSSTVDVFDEALRRDARGENADALRELARAARDLGDTERAQRLSAAYAVATVRGHAAALPVAWPRRTAGEALRVAVLASPGLPRDRIDALRALDGCVTTLVALAPPEEARALANALPVPVAAIIATGPIPDPSTPRVVAARDADVLVDACGLDAPTGPWLAARPARALWTIADLEPPLVDRRIPADAQALRAALGEVNLDTPARLDAEAIAGRWTDGLRAHQTGDVSRARAAYSAVIDDQPDYAPARHFRARLEWDAGEIDAAADDLEAVLAQAPRYAEARVDASRLALEAERPALAISLAEDGLARDGANLGLWRALGHALLRIGDGAGAARVFERASLIDPLDAETHYNLGVARQLEGDAAAAVEAYRHAMTFDPSFPDAAFNLGVLFQQQDRRKASASMYRRVLAIDPTRESAWKNLGEVLREAGDFGGWAANFRRFEAACPESLLLAVQALEVCQFQADFTRLDRYLDGLRQERYRAGSETSLVDALEELLYLLLFFDVEPSVIHRFARTYDQATRRVYGVPRPRAAERKPGKIRIGYLSADLRNHVMGKMMWDAVRHHDRDRFDLYFYALSSDRDRWTERYESIATAFRDLSGLADRAAARAIDGDDLDLLVDLQTHTRGARPGILALKPARVQITHVASAGTLGLSAIDYKLTDAWADLPEAQEDQIEPLLVMGGSVYPWRRVAPGKIPPLGRAQAGVPEEAFVIGAFVTPMKLSRRCLSLWKEIAERVPRALFVFSPLRPEHRGAYERLMAAAGIARERFTFLPQASGEGGNRARYRIVDVVLDPMPFGNVNGTIEPLSMGVPVVTMMGKRHGERTSWSILANLGVTSTVAASGRDYVELAVRLAQDEAFMRETRQEIVAKLATSPLTDGRIYARHLEAAYVVALGQKAPEALASAGWPAPT